MDFNLAHSAMKATEERIYKSYSKAIEYSMSQDGKKIFVRSDRNDLDISKIDGINTTKLEQQEFAKRFDMYIKQIMNTVSKIQITEGVIGPLVDNMKKTKTRWSTGDIEEEKILDHECKHVDAFYNLIGSDDKKFFAATQLNNPSEYRESILGDIELWRTDDEMLLGDYRYLQTKTKRQIFMALKNDIRIFLYRYIQNEMASEVSDIWSVPNTLGHYPILPSTKSKLNMTDEKISELNNPENRKDTYFVADSYKRNDITFVTSYNIAVLKEEELRNTIGNLDELDLKIVGYLLSLRDEYFFRTREVITTIGDIVNNVGLAVSGSNYMVIRERLFKLRYAQISAVGPDIRGFSSSFIDNLEIFKVNSIDRVRVLFNIEVVQQAVNDQTINMYGDVIRNFKNQMSYPIIMNLQRIRIQQLGQGQKRIKINYNLFNNFLYMNDRYRSKNMRRIDEALQEIVQAMMTVKEVSRDGDFWEIEFLEITPKEKRDLFNNLPLAILGDHFPKYMEKINDLNVEQLSFNIEE